MSNITVTELIGRIRNRAAEDSDDSTPGSTMLDWLNAVFMDFCKHAFILQGNYCIGGPVNATGRYPLNDVYHRRFGNGGPLDGANDVGPLTIIPESISEVSWDYWGGTSGQPIRYLDEISEYNWQVYTGGENPSNTTTDQPVYFMLEDGVAEANPREQIQFLRLWPKELTVALGSAGAAGSTLQIKAAREPLVMVENNPTATQTDVFEVSERVYGESIIAGVLAFHYLAYDQPVKSDKFQQMYYAQRQERREQIIRKYRASESISDTDGDYGLFNVRWL